MKRSDKGPFKTDRSRGGVDRLRAEGLGGRANLRSLTLRPPPPHRPSPNTLGARTWGRGRVASHQRRLYKSAPSGDEGMRSLNGCPHTHPPLSFLSPRFS